MSLTVSILVEDQRVAEGCRLKNHGRAFPAPGERRRRQR